MFWNKDIPNNNNGVIPFLARNFSGTKKVRNTILFYSAVISIIAITMVFGIPSGKIRAEEIRWIREKGTASSGMVVNGTEEQYNKLRKLDYIKHAGKSVFIGEAAETCKSEDAVCKVAWADFVSWEYFMKPAYTNIIGKYPENSKEILLSERALKSLGISEPKQDMEINLEVSIGLFHRSKERFKLCGWYKDFSNELPIGYVSRGKIDQWDFPENHYTLLFRQSDYLGQNKTEEKLYQTLPMKNNGQKIIVSDTARYIAVSKLTGGYEMAVLGTVSILCGIFFLVYNVLWISMNEDIRNLGLLNTIGATEKQITKIYRKQMQYMMLKGSVWGILLSVIVLIFIIPEILGIHFFEELGGKTIFCFFRPWILLIAVIFVNGTIWMASERVIKKIVDMSCVKSAVYEGNDSIKRRKKTKKMIGKRTAAGEMLYLAWKNVTLHKTRFVMTGMSMFLGIFSFLIMNVIIEGCDYIHIIEKYPDFLLAGEFSEYGKSYGYGEEYKTREIDEDPLLTQGDGMALLYDNDYDEFSPISKEVNKKIHKLEGVDWKKSNSIEGAYLNTVISKRGIQPYNEGISDISENNMIEGFSWDTVQILKPEEIKNLKKYIRENQLKIDIESLENGTGVLIIHDHMLTPEQQKLAENAVGEPVYFKTMLSREDAVRRKDLSGSDQEEEQKKGGFYQKSSGVFSICGYLDSQSDDFPEIHQSWHGAEGSLYFFISENGFQKIPTEKKTLSMELNAYPGKESYLKSKIKGIIAEENNRRSKMTEVSLDEGAGEAGIFVICKSDLIRQKEIYMRGNRILLGSISIILLIAGLANYFNVVITGMYARRKEFRMMQSIGMTDKQMKMMLYGEGICYFLFITGLLLTAGTGILLCIKVYMENKLSYFVFHWPVLILTIIMFCLLVMNMLGICFIKKKNSNEHCEFS